MTEAVPLIIGPHLIAAVALEHAARPNSDFIMAPLSETWAPTTSLCGELAGEGAALSTLEIEAQKIDFGCADIGPKESARIFRVLSARTGGGRLT